MFSNKNHLSSCLTDLVGLKYGSSLHHWSSGGESRAVLEDTNFQRFQLSLRIEHMNLASKYTNLSVRQWVWKAAPNLSQKSREAICEGS